MKRRTYRAERQAGIVRCISWSWDNAASSFRFRFPEEKTDYAPKCSLGPLDISAAPLPISSSQTPWPTPWLSWSGSVSSLPFAVLNEMEGDG